MSFCFVVQQKGCLLYNVNPVCCTMSFYSFAVRRLVLRHENSSTSQCIEKSQSCRKQIAAEMVSI